MNKKEIKECGSLLFIMALGMCACFLIGLIIDPLMPWIVANVRWYHLSAFLALTGAICLLIGRDK